jgi:hypothetical protein
VVECATLDDTCQYNRRERAILADYRQIGDRLWERLNKDADSLWYYRSLVEAFRKTRAPVPLVDELDRVVTDLEGLAGKSR